MPEDTSIDLGRLGPRAGSRVLVAGGCGDFGRALVDALVAGGCAAAVLDMAVSMAAHPAPDGVIGLVADATDEAQVNAAYGELARHWDGLDGLVNLIGVIRVPQLNLSEYDKAAWEESIAVNLRAVHLVSRGALPLMRRAGKGSIINTSSVLGFAVNAEFGPYGAAKAGVVGLTKTIAGEHAADPRQLHRAERRVHRLHGRRHRPQRRATQVRGGRSGGRRRPQPDGTARRHRRGGGTDPVTPPATSPAR